jgi:hypothetical protein
LDYPNLHGSWGDCPRWSIGHALTTPPQTSCRHQGLLPPPPQLADHGCPSSFESTVVDPSRGPPLTMSSARLT